MLNNLKVGTKLAVGFAVAILALVIVAGIGISRIASISEEVSLMVNDRFPKTEAGNNIVHAVNITARALRNAALVKSPDEVARELARIPEARKITAETFDKLDKTIKSDEGRRLLGAALDARKKAVADQDRYIEILKAGKKDEAIEFITTVIRKSQGDYIKAMEDLIKMQVGIMNESGKKAEELASATRTMLIALSVGATLLVLILAYLVTRSITVPVTEVANAAKKMAQGDFNFKLESNSKDEVGDVVRAVASVQHAVQSMTADANMLSQAAVDGKLATRADASKHQGDFQKIVAGVNSTLDSVIGPLNVAAKYVDDISKGDIPTTTTEENV